MVKAVAKPQIGSISGGDKTYSGQTRSLQYNDPKLAGRRKNEVYKHILDNSGPIGGVMYAIQSVLKKVPWSFFEGSDEQANKVAQKSFRRINWSRLIGQATSGLPFGFALFEICTEIDFEGDVVLTELKFIPPDSLDNYGLNYEAWIRDEAGNIVAVRQRTTDKGTVSIPYWKCLHIVINPGFENSPEGYGFLRPAVRAMYFVENIEDIQATGIEKELCGLPDIQVPVEITLADASPEDQARYQEAKDLGRKIRSNETSSVVRPSKVDRNNNPTGWDFSVIQGGGTRAVNEHEALKRHDVNALIAVLGEFFALGTSSNRGGLALIDGQMDIFGHSLDGALTVFGDEINICLLSYLLWVNNINKSEIDKPPMFVPGQVATPNLNQIADYVSKLDGADMLIKSKLTKEHLSKLGKLPFDKSDLDSTPSEVPPKDGEPESDNPDVKNENEDGTGNGNNGNNGAVKSSAVAETVVLGRDYLTVREMSNTVQAVWLGKISKESGLALLGQIGLTNQQAVEVLGPDFVPVDSTPEVAPTE